MEVYLQLILLLLFCIIITGMLIVISVRMLVCMCVYMNVYVCWLVSVCGCILLRTKFLLTFVLFTIMTIYLYARFYVCLCVYILFCYFLLNWMCTFGVVIECPFLLRYVTWSTSRKVVFDMHVSRFLFTFERMSRSYIKDPEIKFRDFVSATYETHRYKSEMAFSFRGRKVAEASLRARNSAVWLATYHGTVNLLRLVF